MRGHLRGGGGSILSQLSLTSLRPIARGSLLEIVLPSAAGLVLPVGGLPANDRTITIHGGSSSRMLYMLPVPVEASQPVGLLTGSTCISFGSGGAAMPSAISLEFASSGRLQPNDKIYVTLPGFDDSAPPTQTGARTIQVTAKSGCLQQAFARRRPRRRASAYGSNPPTHPCPMIRRHTLMRFKRKVRSGTPTCLSTRRFSTRQPRCKSSLS